MATVVNVEAALVAWVSVGLVGVRVSIGVDNPRPDRFVRVRRIGGTRLNLAEEAALVLVECWGSSALDAFTLAQAAWARMDESEGVSIADGVWVDSAGLSSPIANADPDSGQDRYQFTANMTIALSI